MAYSWKLLLEQMTSNGVISEVDALKYDILNKAENHMLYGELVRTTEGITQ
jgi:hypothetical protein